MLRVECFRFLNPPLARGVTGSRVVLEDVAQVVGNGTPHVRLRIVLELLEQGQRRTRVELKGAQANSPGQARPRALADQAANVRVGVLRPAMKLLESLNLMFDEQRPDAELPGKSLGQLVTGPQRIIAAGGPVVGDHEGMRQIEERRQAISLRRNKLRAE